MKIIINKYYGGFGISDEAFEWLIENKKWTVTQYNKGGGFEDPNADIVNSSLYSNNYFFVKSKYSIEMRTNPDLIECIETLGKKADGKYAVLKIIEIPDDIEIKIEEYDGIEYIAEKNRTWS